MDIVLLPAYGRNYRSGKAALADWQANKDFMIATVGPSMNRYVSKASADPSWRIWIRYGRARRIVRVPAAPQWLETVL